MPTFSSKIDLVTVDVVVQDGKGRPVRGLTAADFTLLEDGKPQAIATFEGIDLGEPSRRSVPARARDPWPRTCSRAARRPARTSCSWTTWPALPIGKWCRRPWGASSTPTCATATR